MSEARFPISDERREQLRLEGAVSISKNLLTAGLLLVSCTLLYFIAPKVYQEVYALLTLGLEEPRRGASYPQLILPHLQQLLLMLLFVLLTFSAVVSLVGLLQTRFLFRFSLVSFRFNRLLVRNSSNCMNHRLADWLGAWVVFAATAIGLMFFAFSQRYLLLEKVNELSLNNGQSQLRAVYVDFGVLVNTFLIVACIMMAVIGVLSYYLIRWRFDLVHAMTRAEVEAEQREQESQTGTRDFMQLLDSEMPERGD